MVMRTLNRRWASLVLVSACVAGSWSTAWAEDVNACVDCHKSESFFAKYPRLHAYYEQWVESAHARAGTTCDDCHGGDPRAADASKAHKGVKPVTDPESRLYFQNQPRTCGKCHDDKARPFKESKHFAALMEEQRTAPTCTTCHPAMSSRPQYRLIILNACRACHAPGNEAGLPPVADQAEHALHQLNIASGLLGWTSIHYEALGWPGESGQTVDGLRADYEMIVARVHRFDLNQTDAQAADLVQKLQGIFEGAREEAQGKKKAAAKD
jgi:nitrate/TMAO reductase-like tetraheme cytochrome c subunit